MFLQVALANLTCESFASLGVPTSVRASCASGGRFGKGLSGERVLQETTWGSLFGGLILWGFGGRACEVLSWLPLRSAWLAGISVIRESSLVSFGGILCL